jgi:hypothetical protein
MRFIKTYKLFESSSEEEEIINYLKDIFLEIEDKDIDVNIIKDYSTYREVTSSTKSDVGGTREVKKLNKIVVEIGLNRGRAQSRGIKPVPTFLLEDVYETILTTKSYMSDEGFFISNIKVDSRNTRNQFHSVQYHYDLFDMRNSPNYKITRPIVYLELEFKKI